MIFGTVIFFGKKVMEEYKNKVAARLDTAAIMVVNDVVKSFGNPPAEPDGKRGFKKNSSKSWKRKHHSIPGQPPFVQTGHLRRSITFDAPDKLTRRVGSTLKPEQEGGHSYAYYLEVGTAKMQARPYLRPAVLRNKKKILEIVRHG